MPLDADAITRLYADHARDVLRFCARRTLDPETAVDLVAECFALAFEQRRSYRGGTAAEALGWLYGIARNLVAGQLSPAQLDRDTTGATYASEHLTALLKPADAAPHPRLLTRRGRRTRVSITTVLTR